MPKKHCGKFLGSFLRFVAGVVRVLRAHVTFPDFWDQFRVGDGCGGAEKKEKMLVWEAGRMGILNLFRGTENGVAWNCLKGLRRV